MGQSLKQAAASADAGTTGAAFERHVALLNEPDQQRAGSAARGTTGAAFERHTRAMLLSEVVTTAAAVAGSPARNDKIAALADLLRRLEPAEIPIAVGFLAGEPRQGKVGVGWATLQDLEETPVPEPELQIAELDAALDALIATTGPGSTGARSAILGQLMGRATVAEQGFIRALLVGELRQGALAGVMTNAVAKAAEVPVAPVRRALMLSGDLGTVARIASESGVEGLGEVGLQIFRPVQPMLASISDDLAATLAAIGPASVEWKLDGIRVQIHRLGDEVRAYTRNLNDVTERVPGVVEIARALPAESFVLDGEALAYDAVGMPSAFQDLMSRLGVKTRGPDLSVGAFLFDCLHLDGRDLIDEPLTTRIEHLMRLAPDLRIPSVVTSDPAEAEAMLADALAAGHEGVMVKAVDSTYQAGRRGKAWLKVKPAKTFDLVVLGAEWGHGRRQGWLSNLHLGARDPDGGFVMVGKTFKGLTDEMLAWQTERLLELEAGRQGITVFVRPELVVEIDLDGVLVSPRYPGGVALRFARVVRYRDDKDPADADTIESLRALLP